jgi:hypothetical protein
MQYQEVPGALFLVVKRPGHEADYSPQPSFKVELHLCSAIQTYGMVINEVQSNPGNPRNTILPNEILVITPMWTVLLT